MPSRPSSSSHVRHPLGRVARASFLVHRQFVTFSEFNSMKIMSSSRIYNNKFKRKEEAKILPNFGIKDVWTYNMKDEFAAIRRLLSRYTYVAMDTEFPGVVAKPTGDFISRSDYKYQMLRCNVDLLRIIQLGISFFDVNGKCPPGPFVTWQFNFKFNLSEDMYAEDSIKLLTNSRIQFEKLGKYGIDPLVFAEFFLTSGMILSSDITWVTFHSCYDFGYLLKMVTDDKMPNKEADFLGLFSMYFPRVYDVKYLIKSCKHLSGGLQEVADQLQLKRVGPQHQAGSDSLLTGMVFFKIKDAYFEQMDPVTYCGQLYGLGVTTKSNDLSDNDSMNEEKESLLDLTLAVQSCEL